MRVMWSECIIPYGANVDFQNYKVHRRDHTVMLKGSTMLYTVSKEELESR